MAHRSLAEVRTRLEETVSALTAQDNSPAELFERYEEIAIQVLDSEFSEYTAGELEEYLKIFLRLKQLELGLIQLPDHQ